LINSAKMRRSEEALRIKNQKADVLSNGCDHYGCLGDGIYKAPKSRAQISEYHFFCLEHVRQYNKSWNYHAGLNDEQVETSIRGATTWERPSWPFGTRPETFEGFSKGNIWDAFGFFGKSKNNNNNEIYKKNFNPQELDALDIMGLKPPIDINKLKSRYKYLVKLYHPDRNGGDKEAEERLKLINEAYTTLKHFLS
jgi:hypothetical protein